MPATGLLPDPVTHARRSRTRWLIAIALVTGSLVSAGVAVLLVHSANNNPTHGVTIEPRAGGPTVPPSPALATGAAVRAAQLFSDPVFVDSAHGYALARGTGGAANERLATTFDGGSTWHVAGAPFPVAGTFTTLLFTDAMHGYVFGPAGLIVTANGGASWAQAPITGEVVRVLPAYGTVWAVALGCRAAPGFASNCPVSVAISRDNGKTWFYTQETPPVGEGPNGGAGLGLVDASNAYVVTWGSGSSGLVVTFDSGASWTRLQDPCATDWSVVDLVPLLNGVIWLVCGGHPTGLGELKSVYRSSDGGHSWTVAASTGLAKGQPLPIGSIPYSGLVSQLATVSPTIAWLGVGTIGVLQTLDGGTHWFPVRGISGAAFATDVGVTFIRSPDGAINDGWALGFGDALWRTTDAVNWRMVASG